MLTWSIVIKSGLLTVFGMRGTLRINALCGLSLLILVLGLATPAAAQFVENGARYDMPVFNPATNSYFELTMGRPSQYGQPGKDRESMPWDVARQVASERVYKGVRGRLAIVDSIETHNFLKDTFRPNRETWIGLRYWCTYRKLQWASGEVHPFTGFAAWAPQWFSGRLGQCGNATPYLPVAYSPYDHGFRWVAWGYKKFFRAYVVEYPMGDDAALTE